MLTFPTTSIFIEGADCTGKTTLIKNIHTDSEYRWHIQDRSQISRMVFSKMYDRNIKNIALDLHSEISNLNNRFIFLVPEYDIVRDRFFKRGDEIHKSEESIRKVYDGFLNEAKKFNDHPNFLFYRDKNTLAISEKVCAYLSIKERSLLREVSDDVLRFVKCSSGESYPLSFTLYDDGEFEEASPDILSYEPEAEYYDKIFKSIHDKITNELSGKNEYERREDHNSRRFVYTNDSCISFIQFAIRNRIMDFHTVIRSSNVESVFQHDLKFLYYLASTCFNRFTANCDSIRMRFNLNSAHIV